MDQICVEITGPGGSVRRGNQHAVVLIHGWPLSGEAWNLQVSSLRAAGVRAVTYDRRGFGRSDKPEAGYDYDTLADDLQRVLDQCGLQDVTLVGFSMGGGEVARYVARHGESRLHSVVFAAAVTPYLMASPSNPDGPLTPEKAQEKKQAFGQGRSGYFDQFTKAFFSANGVLKVTEAQRREALVLCEQSSQHAALACMDAFATTDFREDLKKLTRPTLVIHGDADAVVPLDGSGLRTHRAVLHSKGGDQRRAARDERVPPGRVQRGTPGIPSGVTLFPHPHRPRESTMRNLLAHHLVFRHLPALTLSLACAAAWAQAVPAAPATCAPLATGAANAPMQQPAFAGQTRACAAPRSAPFKVTVLASGLVNPWAVEPLPDGAVLVTEKPGRLRIVSAAGQVGPPIAGLPAVDARGQGGLLDVALSPNFASDRTLYWSFAEPRQGGNGTSVARGVLSVDRSRLEQVNVILRTQPTYDGDKHFGSRLAFGPDGMLYITLGERSDTATRPQAQQMGSHLGKVLRVRPDGTVPPDNPFTGQPGALPEIWSVGQRNVQASAFDTQGRFWVVEMGTQGGDEVNLIEKGKNYGWPLIAYGEEYSGRPIGEGATAREGLQQPIYYWDPVIAPSGAQWYTGDAFPAWRGNLFIGALKEKSLVRLVFDGQRVVGEERLLADKGQRVRDVRQGPDGALYVVTDERSGELWKITPAP